MSTLESTPQSNLLPLTRLPHDKPRGHNDALDGVRFFAFFAVFLAHAGTFNEFGSYGVRVFFVLSGFLIGRILLNLRTMDEPLGYKLGTFYARRTLRIFPLYYAVLTAVWLLPHVGITAFGISKAIPWQFLYLGNFYQLFVEMPGSTGHFWTLAIEEQFYLIAPLLILILPLRALAAGCVALWVFNLAIYVPHLLWFNPATTFLLPNVQFGFIAMGVAAAYVESRGSFLWIGKNGWYVVGMIAAIIAFPLPYLLRTHRLSADFFPVFEWTLCIASAILFLALWSNQLKPLAWFLASKPLAYLGRISYGLYVYHALILYPFTHSHADVRHGKLLAFFITIAISMISWHFFEKPINNLKRHFPYREAKASPRENNETRNLE